MYGGKLEYVNGGFGLKNPFYKLDANLPQKTTGPLTRNGKFIM